MNMENTENSLYYLTMSSDTLQYSYKYINLNISKIIKDSLKEKYENKCSEKGFIKKNTIDIVNISSPLINGNKVLYDVVFTCLVCHPVENMIIDCKCTLVSKAVGIKGVSLTETPTPFVVNILKEHSNKLEIFDTIQPGDTFKALIIGKDFKINDKHITLICEILQE